MTPYHFKADAPPPMTHQRRALRHVIDRKGVAGLVMDPGTGKSRVCVDYLAMLALKHGQVDVLITAPLSALDTWPDQFRQWCPEGVRVEIIEPTGTVVQKAEQIATLLDDPPPPPGPIIRAVVLNHDAFASRALVKGTKTVLASHRLERAVARWDPDVLILDESHRFKGHTSNRTRSLRKVAREVPRRLILTGTVAPRDPLDIFGQWLILNPETFGTDWDSFKHTFARWGGFENRQVVRWVNQDMMRRAIAQDAIVVRKADALDLPPLTEITVPIRLRPREAKAYEEMEASACAALAAGGEAVAPSALVQILRLRQITGGYVGYEDAGIRKEEELGRTKAKVAADKVYDLASAGRKVVLFAHFRHDLQVLHEECAKLKIKGCPIYYVDGDTKTEERKRQRYAFRDHDGPAVFIAQMRTMSLAVNELVVASECIFFSLSERRDDYEQARDRINRMGQKNPMTFYHLVVPDTIDEVMLKVNKDRADLEDTIVEYARRKGQA